LEQDFARTPRRDLQVFGADFCFVACAKIWGITVQENSAGGHPCNGLSGLPVFIPTIFPGPRFFHIFSDHFRIRLSFSLESFFFSSSVKTNQASRFPGHAVSWPPYGWACFRFPSFLPEPIYLFLGGESGCVALSAFFFPMLPNFWFRQCRRLNSRPTIPSQPGRCAVPQAFLG